MIIDDLIKLVGPYCGRDNEMDDAECDYCKSYASIVVAPCYCSDRVTCIKCAVKSVLPAAISEQNR